MLFFGSSCLDSCFDSGGGNPSWTANATRLLGWPQTLLLDQDPETITQHLTELLPKRPSSLRLGNTDDTTKCQNHEVEVVVEDEEDTLYYFDAVAEPLGEDEFPVVETERSVGFCAPQKEACPDDNTIIEPEQQTNVDRIMKALEKPKVLLSSAGYPGSLTSNELRECRTFLLCLRDCPELWDQFYSFRDVENEEYIVCRWLRSTNFNADKVMDQLKKNQVGFEEAKQHNFYPDVSETIGAPVSVFLSQYPFLSIGRAKNGCCVNYLLVGPIQVDGIFSVTTIERLKGYFWWNFMWKMKGELRKAKLDDPNFVRAEGINVVDLKGMSSSNLCARLFDVIQVAKEIENFFPETMYCMLLLNAPGFFATTWRIIRGLLNPNTAQRIQVFSNEEQGLAALRTLVEDAEIPEDYGGTNISFRKALVDAAADPTLLRQEIELIRVPRWSKKIRSKQTWRVQQGQSLSIGIHSRSASTCKIDVIVNGKTTETIFTRGEYQGDNGQSSPKCMAAVSKVLGPSEVTFEAYDLNDEEWRRAKHYKGCMLLVGDVRPL